MTNYTIIDIDSNIFIDSNTTFGDKVSMSKDGQYLALHLSNTDKTYIYDINDRNNIKYISSISNTNNLKNISLSKDENNNNSLGYEFIAINGDNIIIQSFSENFDEEYTDLIRVLLRGDFYLIEYNTDSNSGATVSNYFFSEINQSDDETSSRIVSNEDISNVIISSNTVAYIEYNTRIRYESKEIFLGGQGSPLIKNLGTTIDKIQISNNGQYICVLSDNTIRVLDTTNNIFLQTSDASDADDAIISDSSFTIGDNIDVDDAGESVSFNIVDSNNESIAIYIYRYVQINETEREWVLDRSFDGAIGQDYVQISNDGSTVGFSYSGNNVQFAKNYSILQIPITFNIENVDDPIGIVDSNVTIEVIVNETTEIDINSIFTFFIIDSDDTITYSISADIRGTIVEDLDNLKFSYTSFFNDFTQEVITITATDNNGNETVANLTIAKKFPIVERDIEIAENEIFKLSDLFGFNFQNVSNIQTLFGDVLIDTDDFNTITYESKFNIVNSEKFINDNTYTTYTDEKLLYNNEYIFENTISYSKDKNLIVIGYPYYRKVIIYEDGVILQTITDPLELYNSITGFGYSVSISEDGSILVISRPNQKTASGSNGRYYVYYYIFNEEEREFQLKLSKIFKQEQHGVGSKVQLLETVDGKVRHILGGESRGQKFRGSVELWEIQENNGSLQLLYKGAEVGEKRQKSSASRLGNFVISKDKKLIIFNSVYFKKLCAIINFASDSVYNWDKMQELVILKQNTDIFSETRSLLNQKESASGIIDFSQSESSQTQVTDEDENTFDVPVEMFYGELSVSNNDRVAIGQYERYDIPFSETDAIDYFHNNFDSNQFNDFFDSGQQGLTTGICKVVELIYDTNKLDDDHGIRYTSFSNTVNVGSILYGENTEDQFGYKVYLSSQTGKVLFVGAPGYNSNQGKIYIYIYSSNDWQFIGSIIEENSYRLGASFFVNELDDEEILFDVYSASASHEVSDSENGSNNPEDSNASQFEHKNSHFISRVTIIEDSNMVDTVTADVEIQNNYIISDTSTLENNYYYTSYINTYLLKNSMSYSPDANILVVCQFQKVIIYYLNTGEIQELEDTISDYPDKLKSVTINKAGTYIILGTNVYASATVWKSKRNGNTFDNFTGFRQETGQYRHHWGYSVEFYENDDDYGEDYLVVSCAKAGKLNHGKIAIYNNATQTLDADYEEHINFTFNTEVGFLINDRFVGNFTLGKYVGIGYSAYRHNPTNSDFSMFFFGRYGTGSIIDEGEQFSYNKVKSSHKQFNFNGTLISITNVCINKNGFVDMSVITDNSSFQGYNTIVYVRKEDNRDHNLYVIQNLSYPSANTFLANNLGGVDGTSYNILNYCDSIIEIGSSDYEEAELYLSNDGTILFASCPNENKIEMFMYNTNTWGLIRTIQQEDLNIQPENQVTNFGFSMKVYEDDNGTFKIFTKGSPQSLGNEICIFELSIDSNNIQSSIQLDLSLLYYSFPNEFNIKVFENEVYTFTIAAINENINLNNAIENANIEVVQTNINENIGTLTMDSNDSNNKTFQFTANSITLDNSYIDVLIGTSKSFDVTNQNVIAANASYGDITYEYDDSADSNIINTVIYTPTIDYDIVDTITFSIDSNDSTAEELDPININVVGNITTPVSRSDTYKIKLDNTIYPLNLNVEIFKKDYTIFTEQNDFSNVYLGNLYGDSNATDISITWDSNNNALNVNDSEVSLSTESSISLENTQIQPNSANIIIRKQIDELTFNDFTVTMLEDSNITFDITNYLTGGNIDDIQSITCNIDGDNGIFTITGTQIQYTPVANDYGTKNVTITVTPSYDVDNPIEVSSTIEITGVDDSATGVVTLSGDFLPNTIVTVANTIEDIDDTFSLTYTYTLTDSDSNVTLETTIETNTFLLPDNNDSEKIVVSVNVIYTDTSKSTSFTAQADINEFSLITINSISDTNILEDGSYSYDLTTIADSNVVMSSDDVQFEIHTDDSNATISINNNVLTVDPNADYNGPINVIVRAKTDTNITTITEDISFNLTVQSVDDVATGEVTLSGDFLPNTIVTVANTIEDIDDTFSLTYTYTLTDSDSNVTSETTVQTNTFLLPDNNDSEKIVVSVNVIYTDTSKNTSFTAEADINEFSLITINSISDTNILEDGSYSYDLTTIADSNVVMSSDDVQFEIHTDDSNATISINNNVLTVDPNADYNGPINVIVRAKTDTNITTITEDISFNLTVQSVDDVATGEVTLSGDFLPNTIVTVANTIEDIDDTFSLTYTYTLTDSDSNVISETTVQTNTFLLPDNNDSKKIAVSVNLIYTDTSKNTSFTAEADINEFSLITTNSISDTNILEDGSYSYDLTTIADSNNVMSSDNVEFEIHTDDSNATISINNNVLTVDPNADYNGPINVIVRAKTDTNITTITEDISFNLTVQSVNDAPEFSLETITMNEDGVYSIDLNTISSDIDNDNLTFLLDVDNLPEHGDALIDSDEILYYEPDSNYYGNDSFKIKISDGTVTETKTISVTINPVNDPPRINSLSLTGNFQINNDISAVLDYEDVDDSNVTIVYEWSVGSSGSDFEVDSNYTGPNFTIPNDTNYENTTIRLKVTITDPSNEQDEETVEATIGSINLVTTTSIDNEIDEDNIYTFELEDIIFDTDLDVQFSVDDSEIVIDTNTKILTYTPESNFHGTKTFSVISSIPTSVKTQTINFVINVNAVDDLATGDITLSGFFLPNTEVTVTNTITDVDTELDDTEQFTLQYNYMVSANDIVDYEVTVSGSKYYIDGELQKQLHFIRGNTYRFTHSGYSTSFHPFQVKDTDGNTYLSGNEIVIDETTPTSLSYYCTNHNNMGADITVDPIEVSDQSTYTLPDNNNYNKITVSVEAIYTDTTKNVIFGPKEESINEFSLITSNSISDTNILEDGTYSYDLATIADSNAVMNSSDVEFEIHTNDSNATINIDSNVLTVEPNDNYNGLINLVVRAKTNTNITTITEDISFNLTVQPVDDLATGSITISGDFLPNTYINTSFEISDIDDDTNDYTIGYKWFVNDIEDTNQTAEQYLIENSSSVEGKEIYAKLVLNHSDTTKIIEIQSNTISVISVILLNENSVNDSNLEDNEYEYDLTQLIDDEGDKFNVIFEISSHNTSDGGASINEDRVMTFIPTQNFESSTEIRIKASTESNYKEEEIIFNVNFISQDDPLQIDESNATITINEDENEAITIGDYLNFYTVDENDTITYSIDTNNGLTLGNVSLDTSFGTNGQMTYIPDRDVYGTDTIHVIASDGNGNDTRGTITINIINVNDPGQVKFPEGDTNLIVRAVEGEGSTIEAQLNDYVDNPDNKETEFEVTNQPEIQGTIEIEESGKLIYTPTENFSGRQQINIRVKIYE